VSGRALQTTANLPVTHDRECKKSAKLPRPQCEVIILALSWERLVRHRKIYYFLAIRMILIMAKTIPASFRAVIGSCKKRMPRIAPPTMNIP